MRACWFLWLLLAVIYPVILCAAPADSYETTKELPELHHAVDIALPDDWADPKNLKLGPGRKIECATCHGLKDIKKIPFAKIDTTAKDFLRGGPYPRLETFCYECHDKDDFERPNIHVMLDEKGELKEEHCTFCHEEVHKERDKPLTRTEYKLRMPPEKLCYGCHLRTPHFNALEHQSVKPKEKMRDHIKASEKRHGIILPLAESGKLMCATCHSPHQYGVINPGKNPAGKQANDNDPEDRIQYRDHSWNAVYQADKKQRLIEFAKQTGEIVPLEYRRIDREVLLRLPAKNGTLCLACHEFDE